jgi:hypothetical protein
MKRQLILFCVAVGTLLSTTSFNPSNKTSTLAYATCKGENPCRACKNCKYCKRCAKQGLTCGVCKK